MKKFLRVVFDVCNVVLLAPLFLAGYIIGVVFMTTLEGFISGRDYISPD